MSKEEPEAIPEEKAKKKTPLPILIGASAAAAGAAAAAVYFLAPDSLLSQSKTAGAEVALSESGASGHAPVESGDHAAKNDKSKDKAANNEHGGGGDPEKPESESDGSKFHVVGGVGVFSPDPVVVSIRPVGRVRYLKLAYVVETSPDSGDVFIERENRLRDTLNIYLRAVDVSALEDPASMGRIREQIARRVSVVVDPAPVRTVLITDFILS